LRVVQHGGAMGWDRKKRGPASGYYYLSARMPDKPHPVKRYFGRRTAGQLAAADVEQRRRDRERARAAVRAEREATAEADRLAVELREWASVLSKLWLGLCGLHNHKGSWRMKRGQGT
jgi:hypothetical protein